MFSLSPSRLFSLFLLLSFLGILTGCAGMGSHMERPGISIADIQVQEIKTLETVFILELRIMNPNDTALDVRGVSCDLQIDDRHFATGIAGEQHTIPAYGSAAVPVTVYASMFDMISSVVAILQETDSSSSQAQSMRYKLTGKVRLGNAMMTKNLPFESMGELSLKGQGDNR